MPNDKRDRVPTTEDLLDLTGLCSEREWHQLISSTRFITIVGQSLRETEAWMTKHLGRRISLSRETLKNSGDETL